ncbi:TonB-dependent receptor [Fulvivirga sp. M361]|uniref:TonB-dependent receptor n=1 Tax=Fulvivirga sp. M361 TaxID=2594266 RepID=UPI00117A2FEB|nr:TonB-dependent receptor plug domain-containing protein [Fulvivirga sp. M361]TRX62606.1 TonB-dependent receptor [Fulvivirga sp. M361]
MTKLFLVTIFSFCLLPFTGWGQASPRPLREVLSYLQAHHHITFSFADDIVDPLVVTVDYERVSLETFLALANRETGLVFDKVDEDIILVKKIAYNVCVRLVDQGSGGDLSGVQILLNEQPANITTDKKGYARFSKSLTFQDTVSFRFIGYEQTNVAAGSLLEAECTDVPLRFSATTLDEVVVNYLSKGINLTRDDHSIMINTNDMALLPGETDGDVFLAVKNLPGISAPNGKAGNLHIRGSTTDQTLVLYDNIPIYHKGHYFGAISPYNPWIVEKVRVYRSGFGPALGGRVGGALELESRRTIPDSATYKAGLNSYFGAAIVTIPVSEKVAFNGTTRLAYPGSWRSPKLEAINDMVFQPSIASLAENNPVQSVLEDDFRFRDSNANLTVNTENGQVFISLLDVDNQQEVSIKNLNNNSLQFTNYRLQNRGANLQWLAYWSSVFNTNVSLMRSMYKYNSTIFIDPEDRPPFLQDTFENEINDWSFKVENNVEFGTAGGKTLQFGYELNRHEVMSKREGRLRGQAIEAIISDRSAFLHAFFVNHSAQLLEKMTLNAGIRSNYYSRTKDYRLEPRVSLNYQLTPNWSLKSSAGMYSQYITQAVFFDFEDTRAENLSWGLADSRRPVVKSSQWMLGGLWDKNGWMIDLELHQKQVEDLFTDTPDPGPGNVDPFISGGLSVYGADLLIRKNWGLLDAWISYSYLYTEMDFVELNQQTFKTYYDQPHVFNITGTLPWRRWKFSAGWHFSSGVPDYSQSTFFPEPGISQGPPANPNEPVPSESYNGRFPSRHQLDMAVVYDFSPRKRRWKGSLGLSLLNVYDENNLVEEGEVTFGPVTSFEGRYAIGFAPNVMINFQW